MTVLWSQEQRDGRLVEVRGARSTRRLYVDGVLHTSWSPVRPLTGGIWDPMALAALFAPPGGVRRVLVLGLGGGAVVHLLRRHVQPDSIVAIECDPLLTRLARDWFEVEGPDLELVTDDAIDWVRRDRGPPFDLIVDDLFGEVDGEPVRADGASGDWWMTLAKRLTPGGVLVVNFTYLRDLVGSALCQDVRFRKPFPCAFRYAYGAYENAVAALAHRYFAFRSTLDFYTKEALSFRVQEAADGFTLVFSETAMSKDATASLSGIQSPMLPPHGRLNAKTTARKRRRPSPRRK